jgi:hypothetical protein
VQHRPIGQHCAAQAFAFDDRRLPRLGQIADGADRLDAHASQQLDCVEQRLCTSIHRVIAGHRGDVEPAIGDAAQGAKTVKM